ncbi:helix-turn-helix domain-containing protein [bacterium]
MLLADQIKKYRKKNSISQQKLAEKARISYNAVTKIEQGAALSPTIHTIAKIAGALNISIDELIGKKK